MFFRMLCLIIMLTAIAVTMLTLRQRQFEKVNAMADLYATAQDVRDRTWTSRMMIAQQLSPDVLRASLQQASLSLEAAVTEPLETSDGVLTQIEVDTGASVRER